MNHLYAALVAPLAELTGRLGWAVLIVIGFILTYTLCYNIWSSFAFPFYLDFLHYSKDEVAFASKMFGIFMTILGISLGGYLFLRIGRLPTILIGAILPVFGNFVYADLAEGGRHIDMVAHSLAPRPAARRDRLRRADGAAACSPSRYENISTGIAGAAFVAYLSGIVSKQLHRRPICPAVVADLPDRLARPRHRRRGVRHLRLCARVPLDGGGGAVRGPLRPARMACASAPSGGGRGAMLRGGRRGAAEVAVIERGRARCRSSARLDPRPDRLRGALRARRPQLDVADGDHLPVAAGLPRLFHLRDIAGPYAGRREVRAVKARRGQGARSRARDPPRPRGGRARRHRRQPHRARRRARRAGAGGARRSPHYRDAPTRKAPAASTGRPASSSLGPASRRAKSARRARVARGAAAFGLAEPRMTAPPCCSPAARGGWRERRARSPSTPSSAERMAGGEAQCRQAALLIAEGRPAEARRARRGRGGSKRSTA